MNPMLRHFPNPFCPVPPMPLPVFGMPPMPLPVWPTLNRDDKKEGSDGSKETAFFGMPPMPFPFPMLPDGKKGNASFMNIPNEFLQMLMQIEVSPADLEKLQKLLDFIFNLYEKNA